MSDTLLDALGIENKTEGDKHCSPGWAQIQCPFCDDGTYHMGFNIRKEYFTCFKCGWHPISKVVAAFNGTDEVKAKGILLEAGKAVRPTLNKATAKDDRKWAALPYGCDRMTARHRKYLLDRNFDPDRLEIEYQVMATGPLGTYKHRIIAPVYREGQMVSYVGRDITGISQARYKTCHSEDEGHPIKNCLYALDDVGGDSVVVVEGVTDVWRLGRGAVATFGTVATMAQARLLQRFKRVVVIFDNEPQAQKQAAWLANVVSSPSTKVEIMRVQGFNKRGNLNDVGDLANEDARMIMTDIMCGK